MDKLIFVTSNGSLDTNPENKPNAFTNRMVHPITLPPGNEYEIGLVSAHVPTQFYAVLKNDEDFEIKIHIKFKTVYENDLDGTVLIYTPSINISAGDMNLIMKHLNKDIRKKIKIFSNNYKMEQYFHDQIFTYDGINTTINVKKISRKKNVELMVGGIETIRLELGKKLGKVLGFTGMYKYLIYKYNTNVNSHISSHHILPLNGVSFLYIYSDIVQPIEFGGKLVNALDCLSLGSGSSKGFHNAIYRRINTNYISSISIKITDNEGSDISFVPGTTTTCILHLRMKPNDHINM